MRSYFHEAFAKELARSNDFRLAEEPGPTVLRISAHIVNLTIAVPAAARSGAR